MRTAVSISSIIIKYKRRVADEVIKFARMSAAIRMMSGKVV